MTHEEALHAYIDALQSPSGEGKKAEVQAKLKQLLKFGGKLPEKLYAIGRERLSGK